jgi:CelD/BcsL family acetyltransferase involved in cellulose biosynthesis
MKVVVGKQGQGPAAAARAAGRSGDADTPLVAAPSIVSPPAPHEEEGAGAALRAEWCPLAALGGIAAAWRELAARALSPNVFYTPDFALAAAPVFGADVQVLLVWSEEAPRRLVGLFPLRRERRYGPWPPLLVGWTHPYAPLGVPLVDCARAVAVLGAALDFLSGRDAPALLLPLVPARGAWAEALAAALAERDAGVARFGAHRRALLAPGERRDGYVRRALAPRKRKELARQARRLAEEQGAPTFAQATTPAAVAAALDAFMALEARGWKGRAGGAAAAREDVAAFVRRAVRDLAARGDAGVAELAAAGRPLASGVVLRSGDHAWFWKIAYDESAARFSPGVQLTLALTETLVADATLAQVDSCATAGHPMIEGVWCERLALADCLIDVGRRDAGGMGARAHAARFALVCRLEAARRAAVGAVRRMRAAWRRGRSARP